MIQSSNTYCPECGVDNPFDESTASGVGDGYEKEEAGDQQAAALKIISILGSAFLLMAGLGTFIDLPSNNLAYLLREIIVGTLTITAGLLLLPPIQSRIEPKIGQELPRGTGVVIVVVWFIISGIVAPPTDGGTGASAEGAENGEAVASVTEVTETLSETPTVTAREQGTEPLAPFVVYINYPGPWEATVTADRGNMTETETFTDDEASKIMIEGTVHSITVTARKTTDDPDGVLLVEIRRNGITVLEEATYNDEMTVEKEF
jgi:hypothetical protein